MTSKVRSKTCYSCGAPATTKEHVVPKNLFPASRRRQLLTVPSCRPCNQESAKDDEYFRIALTTSAGDSPAAKEIWMEKVRPSLRREPQGLRRSLLKRMRGIYLPDGQGFSKRQVLRLDRERVDRVGGKIVKALYLHAYEERLPDDSDIELYWRPEPPPSEVLSPLAYLDIDRDVFVVRYSRGREKNQEMSIWWMLFYRRILYAATVESKIIPTIEDPARR